MALSGEWSIQLHGFVAELRSEKASIEAKIDAAKGLASIARSDNQNDQMSQQNAIISAGGDDALVRLLADTQHESLQWWVALALTQLVFANERAIEAMVDFSVLGGGGTIREQLALAALSAAERAQVAQDIREHEAAEGAGTKPCLVATIAGVLSNGRGHTTDRVKYGCLHIATNIANKHWGAHDVLLHHGIVHHLGPILRAGNTPALTAAGVALLCCMSYNHKARMKILRCGVVAATRAIARSEKRELNAVSANIARYNLEGHAASLISSLSRGFLARIYAKRAAKERKLKRLAQFFGNSVVFKCFLRLQVHRAEMIEYRAKMKKANAILFNRGLLGGFQGFVKYWRYRGEKRGKNERAQQKADASLVCRNRLFALYVCYMYKEGPWWQPDPALEAVIKEKCAHFLALLSGQWEMLTFEAWKDIIVKKHRALKRWKNASLHRGFDLWLEYMCEHGPWWEPSEETKRQLEEKCSHFLALMSGDWLRTCFKGWGELVRKNKRARSRWINGALHNCFDMWFDDVFVEAAELYLKVQKQCSKVVALIGGEMRAACFHSWQHYSNKMSKSRRFLNKIVRAPMTQGWENWVLWMCEEGPWWEPGRELQEQLDAKCGRVLALINGDVLRLSFKEWQGMYRKNKRALLRWKQQSEHHMMTMWKDFTAQERDWHRIKAEIELGRRRNFKWETLVDWSFIVQQRRYNRALLGDACLVWVNQAVIRAYRALDAWCQEQKHYRKVVADFRRRFELRPAARCLGFLWEYVDKQIHMRLLMKRIKHHHIIECLTKWNDVVQETKIALKEQMCAKSPLLMRWLKRPLYTTFEGWKSDYLTEKRNRQILERMAYRMRNACVVQALHDWNEYVDLCVQERFAELKTATAAALRSGTTFQLLSSLQQQRSMFHRRNVRWNEFVKTYLEDAVAEVTREEQGQVEAIFQRNQRKKARRAALGQGDAELPAKKGAAHGGGGASPVKREAGGGPGNKGSYAARFLPHRHQPHHILPAYLGGAVAKQSEAAQGGAQPSQIGPNAAVWGREHAREMHRGRESEMDGIAEGRVRPLAASRVGGILRSNAESVSVSFSGASGVVEAYDDSPHAAAFNRNAAAGGAKATAANGDRQRDRWGGGGLGRASVDRSQYVRGGGGQIVPEYMLRAQPNIETEDVSGAGAWGGHHLRQREREIHDEYLRQKEEARRLREVKRRQPRPAEEGGEGAMGGDGMNQSRLGRSVRFRTPEERRWEEGHGSEEEEQVSRVAQAEAHEGKGEEGHSDGAQSWRDAQRTLRAVGVGVGQDGSWDGGTSSRDAASLDTHDRSATSDMTTTGARDDVSEGLSDGTRLPHVAGSRAESARTLTHVGSLSATNVGLLTTMASSGPQTSWQSPLTTAPTTGPSEGIHEAHEWPFVQGAVMTGTSGKLVLPELMRGPKTPVIFGL